jgi:hypothetical protein
VTLLKAVSLEKLAKLMLKCGQFDAREEEEEVCCSCLNISTTTLRTEHVDTMLSKKPGRSWFGIDTTCNFSALIL